MRRENYVLFAKSVERSSLTPLGRPSYVRKALACGPHIECPVGGDGAPTLVGPPMPQTEWASNRRNPDEPPAKVHEKPGGVAIAAGQVSGPRADLTTSANMSAARRRPGCILRGGVRGQNPERAFFGAVTRGFCMSGHMCMQEKGGLADFTRNEERGSMVSMDSRHDI